MDIGSGNEIFYLRARLNDAEAQIARLKAQAECRGEKAGRAKAECPQRGHSARIHKAALELSAAGKALSPENFFALMGADYPGAARIKAHCKEWKKRGARPY